MLIICLNSKAYYYTLLVKTCSELGVLYMNTIMRAHIRNIRITQITSAENNVYGLLTETGCFHRLSLSQTISRLIGDDAPI